MALNSKTVKDHLEETYVLDSGFWYETQITPSTPWFKITVHQLNSIAEALDEDVRDIINPKF